MTQDYGIVPPTGAYGTSWPSHPVMPQGIHGGFSSAGWTQGNEGFVQQTFLGASILSFDMNAGFGDTTSSLSVRLVNDEYNTSDGTGFGLGDDVYHNGSYDEFRPPVVGSPVFFKFGKNPATIEQAWRKTFDDLYGYSTLGEISFPTYTTTGTITTVPQYHYLVSSSGNVNTWVNKSELFDIDNPDRGYAHSVFGGILQTYTQTRGGDGNPVYNATIQDPREILSNCVLILRNYAGTTFNNKNMFNIYGFLEYDVSDALLAEINTNYTSKSVLAKAVNVNTGDVTYVGDDTYTFPSSYISNFPSSFPITGQGFARVSEQGIPWYRVSQALTALFQYNGPLPQEYIDKGFGGVIDFRGYKYVVDFSGIPLNLIPKMFFLDFDNIDMLSLAQELCESISHDLFVSLLPVINHPACEWIYSQNALKIQNGDYSNIITGIIRVDAIDKRTQPNYGAIKSYIDGLQSSGVYVENQDVGYEVSNVVTDKFIVGAQEVEMYYFSNQRDRDNLELRKFKNGVANHYELLQSDQWSLQTSLKQQILPFYGFLGKEAVTIPRGFGPYQQILLDSSSLDAYGVGNYYVATEMELRAAAVSYQAWRDFLLMYNEKYMSEVGEDQVIQSSLAHTVEEGEVAVGLNDDKLTGRIFAVDVPRCLFNSDKPYMDEDGYPASPCSPPYGYPLYYKRAEKIGIAEAGLTDLVAQNNRMVQNYSRAVQGKEYGDTSEYSLLIQSFDKQIAELETRLSVSRGEDLDELRASIAKLKAKKKEAEEGVAAAGVVEAKLKTTLDSNKQIYRIVDRLANESIKNSAKVYGFVKDVADRYLGKAFLVKIPTKCNVSYNKTITGDSSTYEILNGPFGFKPQPISTSMGYSSSAYFYESAEMLALNASLATYKTYSPYEHYLDNSNPTVSPPSYTYGALKVNYNPISDKWEYNYSPEPQGGFFNFALYDKTLSYSEANALTYSQLPLSTQQQLTPLDLSNFVEDNGRIKCYARYNNSQHLSFAGLSKDSFFQQKVTANGFVPEVMEELDNTSQDQLHIFNQAQQLNKPQAVAFVKCELDSKFYMAPRVTSYQTNVFGRRVRMALYEPVFDTVSTTGIDGCVTSKPVQRYPQAYYVPNSGGFDGTVVSNTDFVRATDPVTGGSIVVTEPSLLDPDHVYAIITLPGRIQPTLDARYLDGPYQSMNAPNLKNALTCDVVKGVAGFELPAPKGKAKKIIDASCNTIGSGSKVDFTLKELTDAIAHSKASKRAISLALPEGLMTYTSPSPVYPDIVAIPLMSHERCYGPWLSSYVNNNPLADPNLNSVRYSNIGGKIEFIKDETLAPWNYAGYQLMNEAGSLKAQFSNSLLLFVERGGFVMAEAPTGIALARELQNLGPLVTSISVNVDNSIKTTVKMDLYTSRFGKLQKQKEIAIGQAVRERQKIIDNQNSMIRKGIGKSVGGNPFGVYDTLRGLQSINREAEAQLFKSEKKETVYDRLVASLKVEEETVIDLNSGDDTLLTKEYFQASTQSEQLYKEALQNFADRKAFEKELYNSATQTWDELAIPYSNEVHHGSSRGGLPHRRYTNPQSFIDQGSV